MKYVKHIVLALIIMSGTITAQTTVTETSASNNNVPRFGTVPNLVNSLIYDNGSSVSLYSSTPFNSGDLLSITKHWAGSTSTRMTNTVTTGYVNFIGTVQGAGVAMSAYGPNYGSTGMFEASSAVLNGSGNAMNIGITSSSPLTFWTSGTKRMTLSSGGNLGIGTTSPGALLDVNGNVNVAGNVGFGTSGILGGAAIIPGSATVSDMGIYSQRNGYYMRFVTNNGNFNFYSNGGGSDPSGGSSTPIFSIASNGNTAIPSLGSGTGGTGTYRALFVDANGKLVSSNNTINSTNSTNWVCGGNTGTGNTFPNNALGTTDANDLVFITGGTSSDKERMRIKTDGSVSLFYNSTTQMSNHLLLKGGDPSHGLGVLANNNSFSAITGTFHIDGPVLYGWDGGALGSSRSGMYQILTNIALRWNNAGQVVVGRAIPQGQHSDATFAVYGKSLFTSVFVNISSSVWADYVFEKDYKLMPLEEVEKFYMQNKHLPGVPSAKEMEIKGDNMVETDAMLLKKIEELTIHMVELEKQIKELKNNKN